MGRFVLCWLVELGLRWALPDGGGGLGDRDAVGVGGDAGVRPDSQNVANSFFYIRAEVSSLGGAFQFLCGEIVSDHVPGEGVGVAVVFRQPILFQGQPT